MKSKENIGNADFGGDKADKEVGKLQALGITLLEPPDDGVNSNDGNSANSMKTQNRQLQEVRLTIPTAIGRQGASTSCRTSAQDIPSHGSRRTAVRFRLCRRR